MGDHDDGLAHLRVQALHHRQNLFGRYAVQIPGWFIGDQNGGIQSVVYLTITVTNVL